MKKSIVLATCLLALNIAPVFGQPTVTPPTPGSHDQSGRAGPGTYQERLQAIMARENPSANQPSLLTKFSLDFPGGTPKQLVAAIEKAMGKPLNAIISTEDAEVQLPPLKMSDVNVLQLFQALEAASRKNVAAYTPGFPSMQNFTTGYGFRTSDNPANDSSIWYFHVEKPSTPTTSSPQKVCQFYSLEPYLNRGLTVDDITTVIQTGWKMAGIAPLPELNYHKETKMLIAFGEEDPLEMVGEALRALPASTVTRNEIDSMKSQIGQLQDQVAGLKKKILEVTGPGGLSEEKTGK